MECRYSLWSVGAELLPESADFAPMGIALPL
jgi:hypothetical protein